MATTMARCSDCGLDHEAQRQHWPVGAKVKSVSRISNQPHGEIPVDATGIVVSHCLDGRAIVFFDDYRQGSHTFHQIEDFIRAV